MSWVSVLRYLPSVLDAVLATLEVSQSPSPSAAALFFRLLTRSFKGMTQYWKPAWLHSYWRRRQTKCACHMAGFVGCHRDNLSARYYCA